ncbi:TPA: hypothetical protein N0F65_007554, partial [Lagenidium giganteum]
RSRCHSRFDLQSSTGPPPRPTMKTAYLLLVAAAVFGVDAGHRHHGHHRGAHHLHISHHLKFREVIVVGSGEVCPNGGEAVFCEEPGEVCTGDAGNQTCQPRDGSILKSWSDEKYAGPWQKCAMAGVGSGPTACAFDFECLCHDDSNKDCYCMPPDAFRLKRGKAPETCKKDDGTDGCEDDQYCRTKGSKQECVDKILLPDHEAFSLCGKGYGKCNKGLKCSKVNKNFSFREVEVVESGEACPNGGAVVFCADPAEVCTGEPGKQTCQPRDASVIKTWADDKYAGPWQKCAMAGVGSGPTACAFDFECLCHDVSNKDCYCMPPDAFRLNRGKAPETCKKDDGTDGCEEDQYCRTKGSKQECVDKILYPDDEEFSLCGDDYGTCSEGLKCTKVNKNFSVCLAE